MNDRYRLDPQIEREMVQTFGKVPNPSSPEFNKAIAAVLKFRSARFNHAERIRAERRRTASMLVTAIGVPIVFALMVASLMLVSAP